MTDLTIKGLSTKKIIFWILLSESMIILATRSGAFLHEFVGHGLMAKLFGGAFQNFQLTLFAGGTALYTGNFSLPGSLFISLGGIMVNLSTGMLMFYFIKKCRLTFSFTLFGLIFAAVNILSQLQYLILGSYYFYGDPVCLTQFPLAASLAWIGGMIALTYFSFQIMHFFFQFQNAYFGHKNFIKKALTSFLILGVPLLIYSGLYYCSKTPLASTAAIKIARLRLKKEAEKIKKETHSKKSLEEIIKSLEPAPIFPWGLLCYLLSTLFAFASSSKKIKANYPPFPDYFTNICPWMALSVTTLALIAFLW